MGMIFKGLTFGGINSLDYGIFITGEAVYNAPERSVTSIEIEGRNGDLLIDNGRFLNIEVSYPAGCFAETQQDFKEKIELFRNAIVSQISYQRLTDDYNPDEYRLAVYKSGLDVNVAVLHQGGEFTLTFDCKPQRFLTSGETERSIPEWSDMHTDSGSIVTVDNSSGEYAVKSLSTEIVPQQSGSGDPSPTNIRPITGFNSASIYVSPTTSVGDATTYNVSFGSAGTVYGGTLDVDSGQLTVTYKSLAFDGTQAVTDRISSQNRVYYQISDMATGSFYSDDNVMCNRLEKVASVSNEATTPPSIVIGYSNNYVYIQGVKNIGGANITDLASFNTWVSANNIVITYPLATPLTYQLTATQVALLLGTNNLWSNTGDIQIEYGKGGNTLFNPTLFDSRPLIELTGAGTLGINNYIITITGSGKLYIDCDTMEAYTITGGIVTSANNRVSLNTTDYPVLRSGMNNLSVGTGISNVKITPRWWRV